MDNFRPIRDESYFIRYVRKGYTATLSKKDLSLKAMDRSQYKLHISVNSDDYTKDIIGKIFRILDNTPHIHTFKHVDIQKLEESKEAAKIFRRLKSAQFGAGGERLLQGDQFTIYLPYFIDLEETIKLINEIEEALTGINAGEHLDSETIISQHVNLRREYGDDEQYIPSDFKPETEEKQKVLDAVIKSQKNHLLTKYYQYKQREKNNYDNIIDRLVKYIHNQIPQPEYKKSFLGPTFGASKTEEIGVAYKLIDKLIDGESVTFTPYETKLLDNSELSPIYRDLVTIINSMEKVKIDSESGLDKYKNIK